MPHALVRISEHQREQLFASRTVRIRRQFVEVARSCHGSPVLVCQSARRPAAGNRSVGCFAKAVMGVVLDVQGADTHFDIVLDQLQLLSSPSRGLGEDHLLVNKSGRLRGWVAASDVRAISREWYLEVVGEPPQAAAALVPAGPTVIPIFRDEPSLIRNPNFRAAVYTAYEGRCAISGISMIADGRCGLQAAHCFPVSEELRFDVPAGILLAPNWHMRIDIGAVLIHDDYTWSAPVEDRDTLVIIDRRILLPAAKENWPDKDLLRRRRALLGHK